METSDGILELVDFVCFDSAELVSDVGFMGLTLLVDFLSKLPSQSVFLPLCWLFYE